MAQLDENLKDQKSFYNSTCVGQDCAKWRDVVKISITDFFVGVSQRSLELMCL